jgi:rubrerythrin
MFFPKNNRGPGFVNTFARRVCRIVSIILIDWATHSDTLDVGVNLERREKLVELLKTQIKIENEHVKRIGELEEKVGNAAAKLLLLEMRLDSQKHAGILTGILGVMKQVPSDQTLWQHTLAGYVDPMLVKKSLEIHIKMETDVLDHVKNEMKHTKDKGLKLLLQHIQQDEQKHHIILQTIVKNLYKINTYRAL